MRKIVFGYGISADCRLHGYHDAAEFHENITDEELDQEAWERAVEIASRYGYSPKVWRDEFDEEDEDWSTDEYADIDGWWEYYDADKHDAKKPGGGSWFD